jgi:lipid-binding SYLF domain-containing protein
MRSGLWTSGSGGSGILIARKMDGTWSPPSGLSLQTATLAFFMGVDIYDCVVVINSFTTLEAFGRTKVTLGTDVHLTNGPVVAQGLLENETWADLSDNVFTYVKSKGQAVDVRLDGTVLNERSDENERFYGMNLSVPKILAGDVNQSLPQLRSLSEMLKAAEGRTDFDAALVEQLASQPTPGDAHIETPTSPSPLSPAFGIPNPEDPDPFGVLALGLAGMEIREAGTHLRPESSQFEYCPSPATPFFPKAGRQSLDTYLSRSNRGSYTSNRTIATERSHMTDAGTQTDVNTVATTPSPEQSEAGYPHSIREEPEDLLDGLPKADEPEEMDYTKIDISALRALSAFPDLDDEPAKPEVPKEPVVEAATTRAVHDDTVRLIDQATSPVAVSEDERDIDADDEDDDASLDGMGDSDSEVDEDDDDDFEDTEEPIIYEVATVQAPRQAIVAAQAVQMKGAVVTIPRRVAPPLPVRSPARLSRKSKSEFGDVSMISSPLRNEFALSSQADDNDVTTPRAGETFAPILGESSSSAIDEAMRHLEGRSSVEAREPESRDTPTPESLHVESSGESLTDATETSHTTLESHAPTTEPTPKSVAVSAPSLSSDEETMQFVATAGHPVPVTVV